MLSEHGIRPDKGRERPGIVPRGTTPRFLQSLGYVYSRETKDAADIAKVLTEDEARRIASNIAKLPYLLGEVRPDDNIQAVGNLSDERHDAEDTTPKDDP